MRRWRRNVWRRLRDEVLAFENGTPHAIDNLLMTIENMTTTGHQRALELALIQATERLAKLSKKRQPKAKLKSRYSYRLTSTSPASKIEPQTFTMTLGGAIDAAKEHAIELPGCVTRIEEKSETGWKPWHEGNWANA